MNTHRQSIIRIIIAFVVANIVSLTVLSHTAFAAETTITITTSAGAPLASKSVQIYKSTSGNEDTYNTNTPTATVTTNAKGELSYDFGTSSRYTLSSAGGSSTTVVVASDSSGSVTTEKKADLSTNETLNVTLPKTTAAPKSTIAGGGLSTTQLTDPLSIQNPSQYNTLGQLIADIPKILAGFIGVASIFGFLFGAYQYLISQGNEDAIGKAKLQMIGSVIAFFLVLSAAGIVIFAQKLLNQ